jgi:hypothetical protein
VFVSKNQTKVTSPLQPPARENFNPRYISAFLRYQPHPLVPSLAASTSHLARSRGGTGNLNLNFKLGHYITLTTSGIFAFFLARQPQDVLLHRFPSVKPCANENFPYPLVILRLGATLTRP